MLAASCQSIPGVLLAFTAPDRGNGDHGGGTSPLASPSLPPASALSGCQGRGSRRSPLHLPLSGSTRWRGTSRREKRVGARGCWQCRAGDWGLLWSGGCRAPGTHQAVLMDTDPILMAQLPNNLGVTVCSLAQHAHCRGTVATSPLALRQGPGGANTESGMGERFGAPSHGMGASACAAGHWPQSPLAGA